MNDLDKIKTSIQLIITLTDDEWSYMSDFLEMRELKKNEFYLKEGRICDSIAYINSGSLIYNKSLNNGTEVTTDFAFEGEWVADNFSRLNDSPSSLNIKAIEKTELLIVRNKDLAMLYTKLPKLEKMGRILMEQAFLKMTQLSIDLQVLSAKERYLKLIQDYPDILQKVPLYHIANYLGIAPKSLSRIRNTIFYKD